MKTYREVRRTSCPSRSFDGLEVRRTVKGHLPLALVVIATRQQSNFVVEHLINKPVFIVDSFRPATGQIMLEWFWFADASEGIILRFLDQANESHRFLAILLHPPSQVF